jgi:ABC-type Na+ transport system ATPase subunit NatA
MLITRIKASNFYGIKDPIEVFFTEGGKKDKIGYVSFEKERVSLISGFYGANASGKSTILHVIDTIIRIILARNQEFVIVNGVKIKQDIVMALPNFSEDIKSKPIELEMDFIIDKNKYRYFVSITNEGREISEEVLDKNSKNIFSRKDHKVSFENSIKKKLASISQNIVAPSQSSFLSVLLDDSSDLSVFGNIKAEIGISELKQIQSKICFITDKRSVQLGQNNITGLYAFALSYLNDTQAGQQEKINKVNPVVKHFDPAFEELIIERDNNNIRFEAKYENFYKPLPVQEMSAGTREIISYISEILRIIKNGGIVVYDETSKCYHSDMEMAILNLFKDKDINKNNAQIFFSSHNHETFDLLQNDQAHILEKKKGNIVATKVSDFDVKERDNIKRIYRLGSLGGVPDTIDFNRVINNLL